MNFTLINNNETKNILSKLREMKFNNLEIEERQLLTFVEIEDKRFNAYVTRDFYNNSNEFVLHIYKRFAYDLKFEINLKNIQTIDLLEC